MVINGLFQIEIDALLADLQTTLNGNGDVVTSSSSATTSTTYAATQQQLQNHHYHDDDHQQVIIFFFLISSLSYWLPNPIPGFLFVFPAGPNMVTCG